MKKGYLKTLAALATGSLLLSMSLSAFAAPTFNVTTTYNGTDGMVDVTVSDITAGANDEVAFLAEKGSEIVYIDQKTADSNGSVANFTFKLEEADATGTPQTTLRVGSTSEAAGEGQVVALAGKTVTLAVADPTTGYVKAATETTYASSLDVYVAPAAGYKFTSYTVGSGEPVTDVIPTNESIVTVNGITGDCTVTFTFTKVTVAATPTVPTSGTVTPSVTTTTKEAAVIAKATGATEYGILVAETAEAIDAVTDVSTLTPFTAVKKFAALAANYDGSFGVNVQDALVDGVYNHFTGSTYYYSIYAQGTDLVKSTPASFTFAE